MTSKSFRRLRSHYDSIANRYYDERDGMSRVARETADKILEHVEPGDYLLEIASGPLTSIGPIEPHFERTICTDISLESLRVGRKRTEFSGGLAACSAMQLPFETSSFDAVVCQGAACFMPSSEFQRFISEVHRVLQSGGTFAVTLHSKPEKRHARLLDRGRNLLRPQPDIKHDASEFGNKFTIVYEYRFEVNQPIDLVITSKG